MSTDRKALAERRGWSVVEGVTCVACPDCAFTFDADHEDVDGGYSCPACAELAAATALREEGEPKPLAYMYRYRKRGAGSWGGPWELRFSEPSISELYETQVVPLYRHPHTEDESE